MISRESHSILAQKQSTLLTLASFNPLFWPFVTGSNKEVWEHMVGELFSQTLFTYFRTQLFFLDTLTLKKNTVILQNIGTRPLTWHHITEDWGPQIKHDWHKWKETATEDSNYIQKQQNACISF